MTRRFITLTWLAAVWVMLWEAVTWANVAGGVVVAVLVVWMVPSHRQETAVGFRPLAAVRLVAYFLWKLIEASAKLTWEIFTPHNRINAAVISVPLTSRVAGIVTVVANMVSLTPGSVTIDIDPETMTLYIHVLHLRSVTEDRASVLYLESLTLAAFPPVVEPTVTATRAGETR
ncbi:MAG: Na+/H+ antiporter subunit E [Acidimicrobiia bacterium]